MSINHKFYISLEKAVDRQKKFIDKDFIMWKAVEGSSLDYECESCRRMISYYNIRKTPQHLNKTACLLSHLSLLKYIGDNKLNNVLIVEDDAIQVNDYPESFPQDCLTYLGGFMSNKKITDNTIIEIDHKEGINNLNLSKYRIMMTLAYYIPSWEIARDIFDNIMKLKRWRAADVIIPSVVDKVSYQYPGCFIEEDVPSQICNKKIHKHPNEFYEWV